MANEVSQELPEQRLTRELIRISAALQQGDPGDHPLVELFKVLEQYGHEIDRNSLPVSNHVQHSSLPMSSFLDKQGRSTLLAMLGQTQTQLRKRIMNMALRIETGDLARQAHQHYGGAAQREYAPSSPPVFRYQL